MVYTCPQCFPQENNKRTGRIGCGLDVVNKNPATEQKIVQKYLVCVHFRSDCFSLLSGWILMKSTTFQGSVTKIN